MATPSKSGKNLIEFNCKNGVYSLDGQSIKPLGFLAGITTDKNINTTNKHGDGEVQLSLILDKGSTGTLELTARDYDFETDLGFMKQIAQGLAEVQVMENKTIYIGFECYFLGKDGVTKTKKIWFYGVNVAPAGQSLSQNTDGTNESTASYPITISGVNLKNAEGTADFVDTETGNNLKVFKVSSVPSDEGYATFLDSVPAPKVKSETT